MPGAFVRFILWTSHEVANILTIVMQSTVTTGCGAWTISGVCTSSECLGVTPTLGVHARSLVVAAVCKDTR